MFTDDSLDEGGAQLCPCGIATATPQHFTVASHTDIHMPAQKFPAEPKPDGCAPHPAHIRQIGAGEPLRDVQRWFLAYSSPSRSPNPHHLAVLARPGFVRAAPTHPGTSRDRLPPATTDLLRQDGGEGLSPPLNSSAPHGARGSGLRRRTRPAPPSQHGAARAAQPKPQAESERARFLCAPHVVPRGCGSPFTWPRSRMERAVSIARRKAAEWDGPSRMSRPGARCRHCCRSVSPGRSPNPPCVFPRTGLSVVSAVGVFRQRGPRGWGSCCLGSGIG